MAQKSGAGGFASLMIFLLVMDSCSNSRDIKQLQRDVDELKAQAAAVAISPEDAKAAGLSDLDATWRWVTVRTTGGIRNGNVRFPYGASCGIVGNEIEAVPWASKEGEKLFLYTSPAAEVYGTRCPTGTVFAYEK